MGLWDCYCCLGFLIGYTELGDINTHLVTFQHSIEAGVSEESLANSMLVLLVRGLFSQLKFPYAQFPCVSLSGHQMIEPFWNAVCRLERCGFKVLGLICDGLSANRRLFALVAVRHLCTKLSTHMLLTSAIFSSSQTLRQRW